MVLRGRGVLPTSVAPQTAPPSGATGPRTAPKGTAGQNQTQRNTISVHFVPSLSINRGKTRVQYKVHQERGRSVEIAGLREERGGERRRGKRGLGERKGDEEERRGGRERGWKGGGKRRRGVFHESLKRPRHQLQSQTISVRLVPGLRQNTFDSALLGGAETHTAKSNKVPSEPSEPGAAVPFEP
eukprot:2655212-Rhodomonas_salina.1